jgi:hypothetical protein
MVASFFGTRGSGSRSKPKNKGRLLRSPTVFAASLLRSEIDPFGTSERKRNKHFYDVCFQSFNYAFFFQFYLVIAAAERSEWVAPRNVVLGESFGSDRTYLARWYRHTL